MQLLHMVDVHYSIDKCCTGYSTSLGTLLMQRHLCSVIWTSNWIVPCRHLMSGVTWCQVAWPDLALGSRAERDRTWIISASLMRMSHLAQGIPIYQPDRDHSINLVCMNLIISLLAKNRNTANVPEDTFPLNCTVTNIRMSYSVN